MALFVVVYGACVLYPFHQRDLLIRLDDLDLPGWAEAGDRAAQAFGVRVAAEGWF